jgi:hypothetical protein
MGFIVCSPLCYTISYLIEIFVCYSHNIILLYYSFKCGNYSSE